MIDPFLTLRQSSIRRRTCREMPIRETERRAASRELAGEDSLENKSSRLQHDFWGEKAMEEGENDTKKGAELGERKKKQLT